MQAIRLLPAIFSVTAPCFWCILFFRRRRQSVAFFYASLFFLGVAVMLLTALSIRMRCLPLSLALNLVYPLAVTSVPILYLFYLYHLTSMDEPLPRWPYLFFVIPAAQFLYSGYAFYLHDSSREIRDYLYLIIDGKDNLLHPRFSMAFAAKELTGAMLVAGLASIIVVPVYFIPGIVRQTGQEFSNVPERMIKRFVILLSAAFMVSIATLIYHFTRRWRVFMELFWGMGLLYTGYLMYYELVFQRKDIGLPRFVNAGGVPLLTQLTRYFDESKPWLEPDLKISDVASALATNRTYLSTLLKDELKTNFNHFVNRYRVAEARRLLAEGNRHVKMQDIALQAGFNSYTTFFYAFRRATGMSPQEYAGRKLEMG